MIPALAADSAARTSLGLRRLKALLAAVIVLFAMAGAYTAVVILERQATLEDASHYDVSWPLSQAVNEVSRFLQRAAIYAAGGDVSADELQLRFDILLNRKRLIGDGTIRQFIEASAERAATYAALVAAFDEIEPLLLDPSRVDVAARIVAPLAALESRLVGLASEAFRFEAELNADEARNLKRLHRLFSSLSAGLIFCGLGFISIMLWQNRVIRKARDNLQSMADDLQRTSVSHRFLDNIMNGMTEGLVVVDTDGRIGKINDSAERITGHPRSDLLGSPIEILLDDKLAATDFATSLAAVETMRRADGSRLPVRISTSHVVDGAMQGATICVFQDLTEQRRADAERSALREQLYDAQKMQAIGTLAGGIAHDFNNILGSILGYSFLALEDLPPDHPVRPALEQITTAGNRARDLVRQILAYSRNMVAELAPVDLAATAEASLAPLRLGLPANVTLEIGCFEPVTVSGNAAQLDQVIANVCLNAIHAIGAAPGTVRVAMDVIDSAGQAMAGLSGFKGRIVGPSLAASTARGEHAEIWVGVLEKRRYARITVEDTGCGMSRATLARIFEPFFTTKEVGKGTGLGLAAVHGILRTHAGVMHVESAPGIGSRFELYLPVSDAAPGAAVARAQASTPRGNQRILVVDDDPALLELARLTLARLGHRVDAFGDASAAIDAIAAQPRAWDLVVTDRTMPEMGGEAFARAVRALRRDLPIVMMTGFADADDEARILAGGVDMVLFKPLVGSELAAAVHAALAPKVEERLIA